MQHPHQQKCTYTLVTQQDPGMQLDYISTCMCEDPCWALKRVVVIHLSRLFERDPTHTDSLLLNQGNTVYMHKNGISTAPLLIKDLFSISLALGWKKCLHALKDNNQTKNNQNEQLMTIIRDNYTSNNPSPPHPHFASKWISIHTCQPTINTTRPVNRKHQKGR